MERQKPHLGLTWQKRPSPPGAEWSSSSCQEDRQVRGERADDALPPPASAARPRPLQTCHGDAPQPLASPLTLCSLPRPLLPLPSTPERSSSSPTQITAATVHPVPPRWVQRNRHRLLRRQHQPIRPREPSSVFPELIPNFRPPATSPAIRRRLRLPEHAELLIDLTVSPCCFLLALPLCSRPLAPSSDRARELTAAGHGTAVARAHP